MELVVIVGIVAFVFGAILGLVFATMHHTAVLNAVTTAQGDVAAVKATVQAVDAKVQSVVDAVKKA